MVVLEGRCTIFAPQKQDKIAARSVTASTVDKGLSSAGIAHQMVDLLATFDSTPNLAKTRSADKVPLNSRGTSANALE